MNELKNIPDGWVETTLGEVVERITKGTTPKTFSSNNDDINYIKSDALNYGGFLESNKFVKITNKVNEELKRSQLKVDDILLSMAGEYLGKTGLVKEGHLPANTNQAVAIITVEKKIVDHIFLWYKLRDINTVKYFKSIPSQSAQPNINFQEIKTLSIYLPQISEQKAIASILTAFDDKIELLQAQNKTLEEMAQTIFAEWFGKYGVDDELPDGWRVGKLSEIAEFLNGLALQKYPPIIGEESLPVIKIREIKQGITSNTDKANTHLDKKYIIENGDVIFSWSGSLDVVIWQYGKGALNQHLFKVSSDIYPKWFYYYWIINNLGEFRVIADSKATTMGHINRNHLDLAQVIIPNEIDFKKLNNLFNPLIEKLENNYQQIQTLTKTRDELLPRLMSGEVRVNEFKK
jgi:type I restriction enzyme S subunit